MNNQRELIKDENIQNRLEKDKIMDKYNKEYINKFIIQLESKGIIQKNEYILNNDINNANNIKIRENKNLEENDFYKNSNKFFFELKINEIKCIVYKIYPDLSKAIYLQMKLNKIEMIKLNNYFDDGLMKLVIKSMSFLDKEQDIKKNFLLPKEYQNLIKDNNDNNDCITYCNLYINNKNENNTNIQINDIDALASFDSLTSFEKLLLNNKLEKKGEKIYESKRWNKSKTI